MEGKEVDIEDFDKTRAAESSRIRRELLTWLDGQHRARGLSYKDVAFSESSVRRALDRICPEEA